MSRKYMDFAPRRNMAASEATRVSLSPRSSRPSSRGSAAMASLRSRVPRGERQQPAQCAKDTLAASDADDIVCRGAKSAYSDADDIVCRGAKSAYPRKNVVRSARIPVEVQEEPQLMMQVGEMAEVENYWAGELGVIEDLGAAEIEEEKTVQPADKPKDDRVGFKDGKSPFINTEKLEKRPLSAFRRRGDTEGGPMPMKNSYAEQAKQAIEKDDVPTMVVTGAGKGATFSLFFVILLVTILGAAVGFVVYLAFFQ